MSRRVKRKPLRDALRCQYPEYEKDDLFALLAAGRVQVNGAVQRSGAELVSVEADIQIDVERTPSGGRGRYKLQGAIDHWRLPVDDMVWLDAGASTGGFTACLLDNGARAIHAVDVGYNQLDYVLRSDSRVHVWERCNIMQQRAYEPQPDAFCMDLSFRSALRPVMTVLPLCRMGWGIVLLKPQFEWKHPPDSFTGVVPQAMVAQIRDASFAEWERHNLTVLDAIPSPIRGRQGNQEFLVLVTGTPQFCQRNDPRPSG